MRLGKHKAEPVRYYGTNAFPILLQATFLLVGLPANYDWPKLHQERQVGIANNDRC